MQTCTVCSKQFVITVEDVGFLKKFNVPAPRTCTDCRVMQMMCFRNERIFYQSSCAWCKKSMVSCFSPTSPFTILCNTCWWSDECDVLKYGRDFDFTRPFFEQWFDLLKVVPMGNVFIGLAENADYTNYGVSNKNCYMVTASDYNQDSFYADNANENKDCCDITFSNKSELLYECVDSAGSYSCAYSQNLKNCNFCSFCVDCIGCSDCIGCVGLRSAQYRVFNKQYSKEQYKEEVLKLRLNTTSGREAFAKRFKEFLLTQPRKCTNNMNVENCRGNYIVNSKNCVNCFDMYDCEDCRNTMFGFQAKTVYNSYGTTYSELMYLAAACVKTYNMRCSAVVWPATSNVDYSFLIRGAKNCFGCISLKKNEYCILNKQYTKEEYEKLIPKILEHMMKAGELGEFFPMKYAPWAYNETVAYDYYPKSRDEIAKLGARWEENTPGSFGKETRATLPDTITEVSFDIEREVFACECSRCTGFHDKKCGRNFKVVKQEFSFYKNQNIPLPLMCPTCRYRQRVFLRNPRKLWERPCAACGVSCETVYAPTRPEKVYCEACYQKDLG